MAEDDWLVEQLAELERLQAEVARLREALAKVGDVFVTRRVYEGGVPYTYCRLCKLRNGKHEDECLFAALSTTADDWLQQHDAEVRATVWKEIQEILDDHKLPGWDNFVQSVLDCIREEQRFANEWLEQHDAGVRREEQERCLTRRFPIPMRRIRNVLSPMCSDEDDKAVREWLDNIAAAIREQEADDES